MFTVLTNKKIAQNVYEMTLAGDTSGIKNAGQFVNVKIDGLFLRRPISVCDYGENFLKIIYKVVGRGTEKMSAMSAGQPLDILTGLGNGYDLSAAGDKPLLIGGGVGVPPLYNLAKKLLAAGKKVSVILGFNTESEIFYEEEFRALGADVTVATADGSYGVKGFVTAVKKNIPTCTPAVPNPCSKPFTARSTAAGNIPLKSAWGADSAPAWAAAARPNTAASGFARTAPCSKRRR